MALPSTQKVLIASLMVLLAAMAAPPATTGQPLPGKCDDLGLPHRCSDDACRHECGGMGGDSSKAYCNNYGKCCCPARNVLVCEHYDHCRKRIAGCMEKCKNDWALDPAGAYCNDGSGDVRDSCCCRPNATAAAAAGDFHHRHFHIHHHQLDLPH